MTNSNQSMKSWANDDKPREKLFSKGLSALSNSELLSILLNTGSKEKSALELAKEILFSASNNLNELGKLSIAHLRKIEGIGDTKAAVISAAIELGRRRCASEFLDRVCVRSSSDIAHYIKTVIKDFSVEVFAVMYLNKANKVKHFEIIARGGITGCVADPRVILRKALEHESTSLVLAHNHPSGNLKPSRADEEITYKIKEAAKFFDIAVIDHIIVSEEGYYSFADEGIM